MADLGSIILRRGTTAERLTFVPLKGEIIYDTELKQVFVGDGETYGGNNVFNETLVVDDDNNLLAGGNLAIVIDDTGEAKSLRLPGGDKKDRPNPVAGSLRYNTNDKVVEYADGNEWFFFNKTVISGDVAELFVSLDGHDDRRYGAQRGRSWGTAFRTINMAMRTAEDIINANPQDEPFVNNEQRIKIKQILVHVATGIYEEQLPIKVPENTSIFGAGQRRTTVRPAPGVSTSPWAKIRFWRETSDYPTGYFGHHYLTDPRSEYSTPKNNEDNDVFLCNSTNWFHDFTTDNHASFAFVLDPEGQILTKSPYPHTGASFAKSSYNTNPYAVGFHGGMFADGFAGNQDFNVDSIADDNLSMIASGFWRKPNMPTAFYSVGQRYQAVNIEAPDDARLNAVAILNANKAFIQAETIQYVNDTYLFDYDRDKCQRDLQFILRASSYDSILGTNYFGRISALAYTRPNSAYVSSDQLGPTIGGLNYAKGQANTALGSITSVQQANTALFNNVIDVLQNGATSVNNLVFPDTVYDDAKDYARNIISANKSFIKAEVLAWILFQINNEIKPFTASYTYDQTKCQRDIDFLLDALQFDLSFEGNTATIEVANSYWNGINSQIPEQKLQHVATFAFIKTIIDDIMRNQVFTVEQKQQVEIPQVKLENPTISEALITRAQDLITIVQEVVQYGTNYAPLTVAPNFNALVANTPPAYVAALESKIALRTTFVSEFPNIITSTINFIDTAYASFVYDEATCERDVGLIIDAMIHDLTYGGESETIEAASTYFETGSTVVADQEAETTDAINKARDVALACLAGETVTPLQSTVVQTIDETVAEVGTDTIVTNLFAIITNLITNYVSIKAAHDLILSNIEWIQDEVIAYTNATYPTFDYNQTLCRRDTGYIIAAISNDLFGGTRKSVEAGRSYYRGVSSLGDPSIAIGAQLTETLDANNYAKYLIRQVLSNAAPAQTYQSATSQTTNSVIVSDTYKTLADNLYDIILDIMENGEAQGPQSLPKYKINISSETPLEPLLLNQNLTMITAGNKSFVSTDWTMFGNLGYGALARNNARIELVSIFTYYCGYTYKAESGSEIRSLNGSSSNGIYGLGAEGRNPFEVPVQVETINETVFVATADSTSPGDNQINDLQIVLRNPVDYNGNPAQFFNVMVAQVDHGLPTGVVSYEIGNFQGTTLNIRGSAQGLLDAIPDGANVTIRLLQEYLIDTDQDISDLLLGAALIYDKDINTGYRILEVTPESGFENRFKVRTIPSINHISLVVNPAVTVGNTSVVINATTYGAETLVNRRIAHEGVIYKVTAYNSSTRTLTLDKPLEAEFEQDKSIRLSPAPGDTGKIFKDFSVVKASNHDMLDVGTGSYEDSNYPRELYGPPVRPPVQSQEVQETAPGRVFFVTNDQDGNYRVGDYFRVNQGDGSVSFSAAIALSNLDGLGFTRGVTVNEFSADSEMTDVSDEAIPTEQAVVNYINKRIGQDQNGVDTGIDTIGPGVLLLDGSASMTGNIDMDSNNIDSLNTLNVTTVDATTTDTDDLIVNTSATISNLTNNRIVLAGTDGLLEDDANLTFNGTTLSISSLVDITGNTTIDGNLITTGDILPDVDDTQSLGSPSKRWQDLYVGPGTVYINNAGTIKEDATGNLQFTSANNKNITLRTPGTGKIKFEQSAEFDIDLTILNNLDVNGTALVANLTVESLTASRVTFAGTDGVLIDNSALTFNSSTGTLAVTGYLTVSNKASLGSVEFGNLTSGRIPFVGTSGLLQDEAALLYNTATNTLTIDGNQTITGTLDLGSTTVNDNVIDINGSEIYATGTSASGHVYIIPGFNESALGNVTIQGNLNVTGVVSTTDVGLGNTQINGNFAAFGNVDLGNTASDPITVTGSINSSLIPLTDSLVNLGSTGLNAKRWANIYTDNIESDDFTLRRSGDISIFNSATTPVEVFSVDGANGNIVSTGTILSGAATHKGNFAVQTTAGVDKFTVDAATGNTIIKGTLTVDNTVTINATTVTVDDPIFTLGGDTAPTSDDNLDRGIEFRYYNGSARTGFFGYDDSTGKFTFIPQATNTANVFSGTKGTIDANLEWADILNKPDPTVTLSGIITGSATMTDVGSITITTSTNSFTINGVTLEDSSDRSGLLEINRKGTTSWTGMQSRFSSTGLWSVMGNEANFGLYDDANSDWILYYTENGSVELRHDGATKLTTTASGVTIAGTATATGFSGPLTGNVTGDVTGNVSGNAGTATKLATARTIGLTGDVTGSVSFDGSQNVTITATVGNDSHSHNNYTLNDNFNWRGTGALTSTTTADLKTELLARDVFDSNVSAFKTSWSYAGNGDLTDAGRLTELAGSSWLTWTDNATDNVQGNFTALVIAPNTGGSAGKMFVYNDQGSSYAPGWREIWTSNSDGSGSGLDADLLDGQQGTYYQPASTALTTSTTFGGDVSGTYNAIVVANDSHNHSSSSGDFTVGGDLTVSGNQVTLAATATRDKYRVWNSSTYVIGMDTSYTFGAINSDYAMTFQMNDAANRGFWWGDAAHTNAQGAMALSTNGKLTVAHSIRVGHGESDTTVPGASYRLDVSGNAQIAGTLTVTSTNALTTRTITTGAAATTGTITGDWSLTTGSRLQATYADLAEIYATDQEYDVGTIVMFGGEKEVTISNEYATTRVAGVISTDPAFIMNNTAEGQPIALKGRVPVKVEGIVRKGDFIVASNTPGVGVAVDKYIGGAVIGKAIEDKITHDIGLIEVKV